MGGRDETATPAPVVTSHRARARLKGIGSGLVTILAVQFVLFQARSMLWVSEPWSEDGLWLQLAVAGGVLLVIGAFGWTKARAFYNDTVREYNTLIEVLPNVLFSGLLGFRRLPMWF